MSFQNNIVSIKQVIEQAVNTPSTVAQTKSAWLWQVFAPILACQFGRFCLDSRQVNQGDGFVLLASSSLDEKTSIANANRYLQTIQDKASFVISEIAAEQLDLCDVSIPVLCVPEIRTVLGDLIAARLQLCQPVSLPMVIAVTGTNGKTTVSQLIAQLCQAAGIQAAVMGTAGNGRLGALVQAANTTGDVLSVHEFIHQMAQQGVQVIALEASSHGLDQYRLQGVPIVAAVYTNLSHDHLDYHADMQAYRAAKARLFDKAYFPTLSVGVINHDAEYALFDYAKPCGYELYGYGQQTRTDYHTKSVEPSLDGVALQIITPQGELSLHSPLLGLFNVDNLLASVAVFDRLFAEHWTDLPALVANLQGARGRMQRAKSQLGSFIVDYAHTPDALVQVLSSLRRHCTGELIAVFGCGGDRDRSKRVPMTQAGLTHADKVILTADNPRSEDPLDILAQMQEGLKADDYDKIMVEPDRRAAIELAVRCAGEHDIVVIAGKGHETYQEINGVRHDFDDLSVLNEFLTKYQK